MMERSAGLLVHITSLPSEFGIGDLGPQAYAFADFLSRSGQKFWQILPLNYADAGAGYSPYSSVSSAASNILLISPELLVKDGLLSAPQLQNCRLPNENKVNFALADTNKCKLLDAAWKNFRSPKGEKFRTEFARFCASEKKWLHDFSVYAVLKKRNGGKSWVEWPGEFKKRKPAALKSVIGQEQEETEKIKFLQFIFAKQWHSLKNYCNTKGIQILGDMPYYVNHDSVDVWANPSFFQIDSEGKAVAVAGTPPDLFSVEGQLWNMPVYDWKSLKRDGYRWWIGRIKRNCQLFDLTRLDHFRGFSAYWEVSAAARSAKDGKWKNGPGADLFNNIKMKLGGLPFVAEDLGEIDNAVIRLRDRFHFPGMKVLQFAFGENLPVSEHIPHNYKENFFVFTGTHDNNTTRGWWKKDIPEETRGRIRKYCNQEVTESNVAATLIHLVYASVARVAIVPMQDILNLDETARMNTPGTTANNWAWRLQPGQLTKQVEENLKELVTMYHR